MTPTKGQRRFSWEKPGEWVQGPDDRVKVALTSLGEGPDAPATMVVRYRPGARVGVHYHDTDYVSVVVEGSIEVTRKTHCPGDMRHVRATTAYGPLVAGPDGCTVVEFFASKRGLPARFLDPAEGAVQETEQGKEILGRLME